MTTPTSSSSFVSVTSSSLPISLAALTNNFSTHLNADNYLLWRDQITPLLICNDLYGHIDGTGGIKNTLSSTTCAEVLVKHVAKDVWDTLETLFHQQTLSRVDILHDTLLDTYKNDMSIEAYLVKIKGIANKLAAINQPIPDSELNSMRDFLFMNKILSVFVDMQLHHWLHSHIMLWLLNSIISPCAILIMELFVAQINQGKLGDIGATNHMASNNDLMQQLLPFTGTIGVYVGNGESLFISHIGDVIKDLATEVTLLKGPVKDNLYPIPAHALSTSFHKLSYNSAIAHTAKTALCSTWHRRLGNPGSKILQQLPTLVLSGRSPYEALFRTRPNYTFLRTFGCSCYPFLGDYGQDKLTPKSRRCIFIRYSTIHRGYHYLDSSSGCIFISRHVVFNETEFPYGLNYVVPPTVSQSAAYQSPATTKSPLAIAFEPLLSHSPSMIDPPAASTHQMEPSPSAAPTIAPTPQSTSTVDIFPAISSNAYVPLNQSDILSPTPPPAPIISNHHPMINRAKDGIRKPRALCARCPDTRLSTMGHCVFHGQNLWPLASARI
ncbi:hypothetical protein SADUNF_Sadunf16G0051000 [Salix dunnii]|uniref:Retroviral polymerase SH3-like domain-containing protein n=1 Tax=Salix dunnii TaxID=1413687 RepID=A0A835J763_9ROSI|nr:hypothetical protein SADUNF_Sadunf16G0051000 [Salix dunnii]